MNFKTVATTFELIEKTNGRITITGLLADLLREATPQEAEHICYVSMGTLNPPYISTQFNIAQKTMIKVVAPLLDRSAEWVEKELETTGDLGSVIEQCSWTVPADLSMKEVYDVLVEIEAIEGAGSQDKKIQRIQELISSLDPVCAKYVVRIIVGTLRLGFSDMTLVDALSWMVAGDKSLRADIEDAYNVCADIGLIARVLKQEGIGKIREMKILVGVPIRPAAAERMPDVQSIMDKMGVCVAQPKFDGFRLQVHVDNSSSAPLVRFFSRNLIDMSHMFPEFVTACKELPVGTFIADGEAMVYDPNTKVFMPFQETVKRRRKHGIEQMVSELPLQLHLFDLLYLDGESLLDVSHSQRRQKLITLLSQSSSDVLQVIQEKTIHSARELENYFIQEIAAGLEGLVIKKTDAIYQPGKRNFNWIKLKYQAADKLQDTIDVVILGYYPGKGKRSQFGIGAFLVGVYNLQNDYFETVAKIGTGLTDHEWIHLKHLCEKLKVNQQPHNVICDKSLVPAVWVQPVQVCEVLADQITLSPVHSAGKRDDRLGFALRFPRFAGYREDKTPYEVTTIAELETMYKR